MECPCNECLVFSMCQSRDILYVIRECTISRNYLFRSSKVLHRDRLEEVCRLFSKTLKKDGHGYYIIPKGM